MTDTTEGGELLQWVGHVTSTGQWNGVYYSTSVTSERCLAEIKC